MGLLRERHARLAILVAALAAVAGCGSSEESDAGASTVTLVVDGQSRSETVVTADCYVHQSSYLDGTSIRAVDSLTILLWTGDAADDWEKVAVLTTGREPGSYERGSIQLFTFVGFYETKAGNSRDWDSGTVELTDFDEEARTFTMTYDLAGVGIEASGVQTGIALPP